MEWTPERAVEKPLSFAVAVLTRLRMVDATNWPVFRVKGPPEAASVDLKPWYEERSILAHEATILFGHWAALGYRSFPGAVALDGGCVWGGELVAYCLDDAQVLTLRSTMSRGSS